MTTFGKLVEAKGKDGMLQLEAITETFWQIYMQPPSAKRQAPSAWTQKIELRPFKESF